MNREIIYDEVLKLEGGVHRKGFEYIVSGIEKLYNEPNLKMMALYREIAKENNDTPSAVERAIRYYIQKCMIEGNKEEINKLRLKIKQSGNPIITEFLKAFTLYLKHRY